MKAVEIVVDIAMIAVALAVGVGYAVMQIVRHHRARPAPEPELHPDVPSAATWTDLATPEEVQDVDRQRMLRQFTRITKTMPDVHDLLVDIVDADLYPAAAEEMST